MGYVKLRKLLCGKPGGVSKAAKDAGIDLNRLYNLTGKSISFGEEPKYFTIEEREAIMKHVFPDGEYTEREVFEFYEDSNSKFFQGIPESAFRKRR